MKRKKIIPLVSLIVLIASGIIGATIYCFNTGDAKKLNNAVEQETAKENLSKTTDTNTNDDSMKDDSDNEKSTEKEKTISKETNSSQSKANTNEKKMKKNHLQILLQINKILNLLQILILQVKKNIKIILQL